MNYTTNKKNRINNSGSMRLPVGGYVCKIAKAKVEKIGDGEKLFIYFDICEGEFKGFFDKQYNESTFEDKKWKGVFSLWLPKRDGSERDAKTDRKLNSFLCDVEDSNDGFSFETEAGLKNKVVGMLFNEGEYNGHRFTRPYGSIVADLVREGNYKIWQPVLSSAPAEEPTATEDDSDVFPF